MKQAERSQSPLIFYLRTLLYMYIALFLRMITFVPLMFLRMPGFWRYGALLCPLLWFFLLLPFRFSFADALVQQRGSRFFSFDKALSAARYGEKLGESLRHLLSVAKWGIPLAAMLGYGYYQYRGASNAFAVFGSIGELGRGGTVLWQQIMRFIYGMVGATYSLDIQGSYFEGIAILLALIGLGVLVLLYGAVRNSSTRYIWALASREETNPRTETRRRMRERRFKQFAVALGNLLLWVPFLGALILSLKDMINDVSAALMNFMTTFRLDLPDFTQAISPLLFCFFVLYMPLLPARRYITAFFSTKRVYGKRRNGVRTSSQANQRTDQGESMPHSTYSADARSINHSQTKSPIVPVPGSEPQAVSLQKDTDPSAFTIGE